MAEDSRQLRTVVVSSLLARQRVREADIITVFVWEENENSHLTFLSTTERTCLLVHRYEPHQNAHGETLEWPFFLSSFPLVPGITGTLPLPTCPNSTLKIWPWTWSPMFAVDICLTSSSFQRGRSLVLRWKLNARWFLHLSLMLAVCPSTFWLGSRQKLNGLTLTSDVAGWAWSMFW